MRKRGMLIEIQLLTAAYGIVVALVLPRCYPAHPVGLGALWLLGLGVARLYTNMLSDERKKWLGLPIFLWAYLFLTAVPALSLYLNFPPGVFFCVFQPYLAFRLQLRFSLQGSDSGQRK